ncbi:MAG: DUF3857 and transglutaminase domain-containing protein [Bacteroidales bacterium]|nr:DUF3857 and transglutaminase domain-containing protein [Bacteroidales bacterium]
MKYRTILLSIIIVGLTAVAMPSSAQEMVLPKYKGYHQVTLFDSTQVVMEESGLSHMVRHQRIRMIDLTGCRNNNVIKIDYDPLSAYVEFREVKVHRNDGSVTTLIGNGGNATVYDYIAPARLIYWGASQKMVEVGHLEPGEEVEMTTYRKGFTYALLGSQDDDSRYIPPMRGHYYDIVPFWASQPVQLKVYQALIPNSKHLRYEVYNGTLDSNITKTEQHTVYTFTKSDIMPLKKEPQTLASNDIECKLLLSTAPNWQSKSTWFYNVNEDYGSFSPTPELKTLVGKLLSDARSEYDSIAILTHWVADNMRYAGISMGEGEGYTLHNAQMNLTDRCGVCKDKASLLIAMLRAAGFKAYAAMTMAGERIDPIPADQFNHSVCAVQHRNGHYELLDPTWVPNVRELWSSAEQQQGYLMGLPEGATLMYTPLSAADKHYIRINGTSKIKKDGTLQGTITITAEGQSDKAVRGVFSCRQSEWRRNLELELLKIDPRAVITKVTHTDNDRYLEQPVSITYHYRIPEYATVTADELIFIPLSARNFYGRAMSHLGFDTTLTTRNYPFRDQCSRLVEISERIQLPDTYSRVIFAHRMHGIVTPAVNYGCSYWLDDGKTLTFGESAMFNKRIYNAADWPAFRQAVANQKLLANTPVILTK